MTLKHIQDIVKAWAEEHRFELGRAEIEVWSGILHDAATITAGSFPDPKTKTRVFKSRAFTVADLTHHAQVRDPNVGLNSFIASQIEDLVAGVRKAYGSNRLSAMAEALAAKLEEARPKLEQLHMEAVAPEIDHEAGRLTVGLRDADRPEISATDVFSAGEPALSDPDREAGRCLRFLMVDVTEQREVLGEDVQFQEGEGQRQGGGSGRRRRKGEDGRGQGEGPAGGEGG